MNAGDEKDSKAPGATTPRQAKVNQVVKGDKAQRLAEALRANLKRRKVQQRDRQGGQ
jgi:hypothetical protein